MPSPKKYSSWCKHCGKKTDKQFKKSGNVCEPCRLKLRREDGMRRYWAKKIGKKSDWHDDIEGNPLLEER